MGYIVSDVIEYYLPDHKNQEDMLKAFLSGFDVTYAEQKEINNTTIYAFMLNPEQFIIEAFGLDKELLLVYSPFDSIQPRAIQAANMLFELFPYKNRIDTLTIFFVSKDSAINDYSGLTSFDNGQSRSIVPFIYDELIANKNDSWFIRNQLKKNYYDVDLFGYTLPLKDESSFFGRQQIVARYIDAIKRCENRGVFGVRKAGKTSLLFKVERIIREQQIGLVLFFDCKSPSYRKLHWNELLGVICESIAKELEIEIQKDYNAQNITKCLGNAIKEASARNKKIIIMFDEIEYISFKSPIDEHWKTEYIDFWQTIWSVQSSPTNRNLVFILSGVNPSVTEIDMVNGVQNPLFGIVQSEYLLGLSEDDARKMIRTLGKRMGINFSHDAITTLFNQYSGHPMLLRLACSYINRQFNNQQRPVSISNNKVLSFQEEIDIELAYYFKHIVSEIQQFYPEEYEMFELLASGQTSDFIELSTITEFTKHLYSYGLIAKDSNNRPFVNMPVAGRYVAMELAKKENRNSLYKIIDANSRKKWVKQRVQSIIRDLRELEMAISANKTLKLFGENSFPEAEKFAALTPIGSEEQFQYFFNVCNRCFVESIENYGKSIGKKNYFWNEIRSSYPNLFEVFHRIKVYRHSGDHIKLEPRVAEKYQQFWNEDTQEVGNLEDKYFAVQQKLLESFLSSIQIETENIS